MSRHRSAGAYSSNEEIPKIEGGEFIAGKFENTLPIFFSKPRPLASVINFDADLYSSTIFALNQSKSVMDKDTVLASDQQLQKSTNRVRRGLRLTRPGPRRVRREACRSVYDSATDSCGKAPPGRRLVRVTLAAAGLRLSGYRYRR